MELPVFSVLSESSCEFQYISESLEASTVEVDEKA